MPFAPHFRISLIGRLGTPEADRFSYGVSMSDAVAVLPPLSAWENAFWTDVANDCRDFHARVASKISDYAVLEMVKVARIGADGKYTEDPIIREFTQPGQGGTISTGLPQSALACSLNTDRRGPTGKGRFYLPMPVVETVNTDGFRISAANAATINGSVEEWIEALNNQAGVDWSNMQVVVASTKGYNTPVTSVRVGRVVDTIRSRRNKIREFYSPDLDVD